MTHRLHTITVLALSSCFALLGPPSLGPDAPISAAHMALEAGADQASQLVALNNKELKEMHRLALPSGVAWQLLEGPGLGGELPGQALYIRALADSAKAPQQLRPWHMPGRLLDTNSGESYYEAEVFVGEVLRDTIGIIWYDRSLMPDGHWKENTLLLNLSQPEPDTLVWFGHGRKSTSQGLAFGGKCKLLKGRDQQPVVD